MSDTSESWRPGSFTKNFSWGRKENGLLKLHQAIRVGFDGVTEDVERETFRNRVKKEGLLDYIPVNFFLFNSSKDGANFIIADELVFQAINWNHSDSFDKLAIFAFNFSRVGKWRGAGPEQRYPALWARHYIKDRVANQFGWDTEKISANDIEAFVKNDPRYKAKTARKLSTNLHYLYSVSHLSDFSTNRVERWWVDCLFLALDRLIEDQKLDGIEVDGARYASILANSNFGDLSGQRSVEKDLAEKHLIALYDACGSRERFSEEHVRERTAVKIEDVEWVLANDVRPQGAVHPTNPRVLKSIPRACAMLAKYAGFEIIEADELEQFDPDKFAVERTRRILAELREQNIVPNMSAEELLKLTREK